MYAIKRVKTLYSVKNFRLQKLLAMFACLMSCTISVNEQCFSLIVNQQTVFSAMALKQNGPIYVGHQTSEDISTRCPQEENYTSASVRSPAVYAWVLIQQ